MSELDNITNQEIKEEIKEEIKNSVKAELKAELRAEVKYEVIDSIKKEIDESNLEEAKVEDIKVDKTKVEETKVEETKVEEAKDGETKLVEPNAEMAGDTEAANSVVVSNETKIEPAAEVTLSKPSFKDRIKSLTSKFTKKTAFICAGSLAAIAVAVTVYLLVFVYNGWMVVNGGYKYYEYGKSMSGNQTIDGIEYIFNEDRMLYEGWISYNGATYYQDFANGVYKNESTIDGVSYNLAADGTLTIGTVIRDDGTYLYDMQGYSVTGLTLINDDYYFANDDGLIVFGWQNFNNNKYYFDEETGIRAVGMKNIDGKNWYFDEDGILTTGFVDFPEGRRYFMSSGNFATGKMCILNDTYLFDENGIMQKGFITIDGNEYYFAEDTGAMFTGWMMLDNKYCYYDEKGIKCYGWTNIEGKQHYFEEENGYMLTGWQELEGAKRYFDESGVMAFGARNIAGAVYLFDGSGRLVTGDGWYTMNNKKYFRLGDGKIATGFKDMDGATYHFASDGSLSIGMTKIGENLYYFYNDGTMARNTKIEKFDVDDKGVLTNPFAVINNNNLDAYIQVLLDTYGRDTESIFRYCRDNFYYKYREKQDVNSMACRMINNGSGACWDYAALCYKMLTAAGYNCQIVVGKGAVFAEHNWIILEVAPGVWRHLDPERTHMWVYMKTDADLEALDGSARGIRYQWDHSKYPAAQ